MVKILTAVKRSAFFAFLAFGAVQSAVASDILNAQTGGDLPFLWNGSTLSTGTSSSLNLLNVEGNNYFSNVDHTTAGISLSTLTATGDDTYGYDLTAVGGGFATLSVHYGASVWDVKFDHAFLTVGTNSATLAVLADNPNFNDQFKLGGFNGSYTNEILTVALTKGFAGHYSGSVALKADAVPEPFTFVLGAASVIGYVGRRRKANRA